MSALALLLLMLFLHIVDDYYLQGILSNLKQKSWWGKHYPQKKYRRDYIVALICHAFSWSFVILLPVLFITIFSPPWWIYMVFSINLAIHAVVDDLKANKKCINLIADQSIHFMQIVVTWLLVTLLIK